MNDTISDRIILQPKEEIMKLAVKELSNDVLIMTYLIQGIIVGHNLLYILMFKLSVNLLWNYFIECMIILKK